MPSEADANPHPTRPFSCSVLAVGTELLLGQVLDTNSAFIGERLALAGIDSHLHVHVGDNLGRIGVALRWLLSTSDAVIVCGGLGPTQDDITREAIAEVLGVRLVRDESMVERIGEMFARRGREMAASNLRQAERPDGAEFVTQEIGTAPGLVCPTADGRVVYAVPGVPSEMQEMLERAIVPDLERRAGPHSVIVSRMLRTWGESESGLAELIAERVDRQTNPTIAFLASGIDGIKVRLTAKAEDMGAATVLLDAEEAELRAILGPLVFGVDDESMEKAVGDLLIEAGLTLGAAESLTGGLVGSRLAEVPGSSEWFRGSIVAYDSKVKYDLLDVPEGPVVSEEAASAMASGARKRLEADVGLGVTGVAGPTTQEGKPVGTVFIAVDLDGEVEARQLHLPGDRQLVRQLAAISLVDHLRRRLLLDRT
ncbi:MAG TPA: competence/damage-inducible protein A [Acidimicrobiales bacterium]|nr:competence/damage-inducible protein A [Acidimicrobiales bacterium]